MTRRAWLLLVVAVLLVVVSYAPVYGGCALVEGTYCGFQCDVVGGGLSCFTPADRCCWESDNSCGDSWSCSGFCGGRCGAGF